MTVDSSRVAPLPQAFDLSLVVPCHNEEKNVHAFFERVKDVFDGSGVSYEIVYVNDGSSDGTMAQLRSLISEDAGVHALRAIGFSRNFGKESAIFCGMKESQGSCVCLIDADLQQDPALAFSMYQYLMEHEECDVVAAYQETRRENKVQAWLKHRFYRTFNVASDEIEMPENMSDFRVFRRTVADALVSMPEYYRFSKGLFAWVGFNTHAVPYTPDERLAGESSWSTSKLFKYAFSGIIAFTTWPLKVAKYIGFVSSLVATLYLLYVLIVDYLIMGIAIPGYPTLVCLVLLFGGLQLLVLGVMGDYQARSYIEQKRRPLYIVKERYDTRG